MLWIAQFPKDVSTVDMDYLLSMLADPNSPSSTTFSFVIVSTFLIGQMLRTLTHFSTAGIKEKRACRCRKEASAQQTMNLWLPSLVSRRRVLHPNRCVPAINPRRRGGRRSALPGGDEDETPTYSYSKVFSQISSQAVWAIARLLCFCTRPCDNCLLLTLPRHKISTLKWSVSSRRPPIRRWAGPIRIFIGRKKNLSIRGISNTFPRRRLKIPQNSVHSFEMRETWIVHKLTKDTNRIYGLVIVK